MISMLQIGQKYGHLTVLSEDKKGKQGERRYICRCDCGNIDSFSAYPIAMGLHTHCRKCTPHSGGLPPPDIVGQTINGWEVLEEVSREKKTNGTGLDYLYRCRCVRCGNESIKRPSEIRHHKSDRCSKCPPMYNFKIQGEVAKGTLPDGTSFLIDAEDTPKIEEYFWNLGKDDYIVTGDSSLRLHRFLLGVTDPSVMVDHINRNRLDNRKSNLRVISSFGNSCNHSKLSTNKTGYIGVYFSKHSQRYEVKIGYHRKRILLGSSPDDLVMLAQMYNVAATYLFGEYVGELNVVPEAPAELVKRVIEKCRKHLEKPVPTVSTGATNKEAA